jgi:ferric-dicitrate binding protein FerR (iron transport regulator)
MKEPGRTDLLNRFLAEEASQDEKEILKEWFRSAAFSPDMEDYYRRQWERGKTAGMPYGQQQEIWRKIKTAIGGTQAPAAKRFSFHRWMPYAAAAVLGLFAGIASYIYVGKETAKEVKEYTVLADKGQRSAVYLPDGTKVWLNSYTEIRYANHYGEDKREVSLRGEAYFEVAEDEHIPFVVHTDGMKVEVLGTSFNIRAYEEEKEIVATVFSGKVQASAGNRSAILHPGRQVTFHKTDRRLTTHTSGNPAYAQMWRSNELAFEGQTLSDIAVSLNRMYNVHVVFKSENIRRYRFSGVIKNNSLENVIEIISLTAPILYETRGDTIVLSEKKPGNR